MPVRFLGHVAGRGNSGSGNFRHLDANFRHLDANFRHLGFPEFSRIFRFQVARHTLKSQLSGGFRGLYSFIYLARHAMSPGKGELQSNLHHVLYVKVFGIKFLNDSGTSTNTLHRR